MASIFQCDRCLTKHTVDNQLEKTSDIKIITGSDSDAKELELCGNCTKDLSIWVNSPQFFFSKQERYSKGMKVE